MQRDEGNNTQAITRVDGQNNNINNDTTEKSTAIMANDNNTA